MARDGSPVGLLNLSHAQTPSGGAAAARVTDDGNGTVTDNESGLIWLKNASSPELQGADAQGRVPNKAAALNAAATLGSGQCGLSDGSRPGDWRLPASADFCKAWTSSDVQGMCSGGGGLLRQKFRRPFLSNTQGDAKWREGDPFVGVPSGDYRYHYTSTRAPTSASSNSVGMKGELSVQVQVNQGATFINVDRANGGSVWPVRGPAGPK